MGYLIFVAINPLCDVNFVVGDSFCKLIFLVIKNYVVAI